MENEMAQDETVLVATVKQPGQRFRIPKAKFDEANAAAKKAGNKSPFIVQEKGCEGGPTFDDLDAAGKKEVTAAQKKRQEKIDAKAEEE
jgi:hypothetical protein